ncbi:asparagine synthase (glutamine-hydrolyzing) [Porticoccus sp. GXU_MW_L64]
MCGIVGFFQKDKSCFTADLLVKMRDIITHRGPDESGSYTEGPVGLGHRRLSIIDIANGHQPMQTEDGRFTIVFNGEVYNYLEIKHLLVKEGVGFTSSSDTEVVLKLFSAKGLEAIKLLNGMFAFAIWDSVEEKLTLARDRAGIKPLYYAENNGLFSFSSEIKALTDSGIVTPRVNEEKIPEYFLFHQVAGEDNLFSDIKTLLPGHSLTVSAKRTCVTDYLGEGAAEGESFGGSFKDALLAFDEVLSKAIKSQMMSDVPLGTFCSGGIDSSLVTAIAASSTKDRLNTFSVGFHEAEYDESEHALLVAKKYNTNHHTIKLNSREYVELLPKLIWHSDLPLNFTNSVHIYAISKLAKERVTVVLTGEGADELFGGYPRYYIPRIIENLRKMPRALRTTLSLLFNAIPDHRFKKLSTYCTQSLENAILFNSTHSNIKMLRECYKQNFNCEFRYRNNILDQGCSLDTTTRTAYLDLHTYLISILNRQDKMSMAASVEARVPFLDNNVISFAQSLPLQYKQTMRHRKLILKTMARQYLPSSVIDRRKSGFGVPIGQWMKRGAALSSHVKALEADSLLTEYFDKKAIQRMVMEHQADQKDHSDFLWSAVNFVTWRRVFGA